ncbi:MAG: carbohydrate porin [Pseudomonadales bacterium]
MRRGTEIPTNLDIVFTLDTGTAGWWQNGNFLIYFLGNDGGDPSLRVGDTQVTTNIEAPDTFKLYEASYEHTFRDGHVGFLVGLHDLNSEFYALEHAGIFLNSSFGIGVDVAQAGPSIFPTTAMTARLRIEGDSGRYLSGAVYDGIPGDPGEERRTQIQFKASDGLFSILEAGLLGEADHYYKLAVGGWYHTADYEDFDGRTQDTNGGIYTVAEKDLMRGEDGRGLGVFLQLGLADSSRNQIGTYVGGGINWIGPLASRSEDVLGFAFAHARNGGDFRHANPGIERAETTLELTYLLSPRPWLTVQPDIQYVINPGTDPSIDNALVTSLRLQLSF